jgi:hypothetical protein
MDSADRRGLLGRQVMVAIFAIFPNLVERTLPGVGHRCRDAGVAQRLGDNTDVPAADDQRLGEGMTQPVRRHLYV